ncbi:MAG: acyltransferase [Treponema sp.]|nr:acyltransferase [Treponema sp.]
MPGTIPRRNNLTLIRLVLALIVLAKHCMDSSASPVFLGVKGFFDSQDAVCIFFFISGLLVTASYERSPTLRDYAAKRIIRIFPLYLVAVIGAALILSLASALPAALYFTAPAFWKYIFWNILTLNFMQRTLPGVFEGNPLNSSVNDPLWTVKTELFFYACLPLICFVAGRIRGRGGKNLFLAALYVFSFIYRYLCRKLSVVLGLPFLFPLAMEAPGYIGAFVLGMLCFFNFGILERRLPSRLSSACFAGSLALVLLQGLGLLPRIPDSIKYLLLACICFYAAFSLRFLNGLSRMPDCSYAIYLFHYPLLQWMISRGLFVNAPWLSLCLCAALTFVLALAATLLEGRLRASIGGRKHLRKQPNIVTLP